MFSYPRTLPLGLRLWTAIVIAWSAIGATAHAQVFGQSHPGGIIAGDTSPGKLVPYYQFSATAKTAIGFENTALSIVGRDDIFVHIEVFDVNGNPLFSKVSCLTQGDFGQLTLQQSAPDADQQAEIARRCGPNSPRPQSDPICKVTVISADVEGLPSSGYVTLSAVRANPDPNNVQIHACEFGVETPFFADPAESLAAWAYLEDTGDGFFTTDIPVVSAGVNFQSGSPNGPSGDELCGQSSITGKITGPDGDADVDVSAGTACLVDTSATGDLQGLVFGLIPANRRVGVRYDCDPAVTGIPALGKTSMVIWSQNTPNVVVHFLARGEDEDCFDGALLVSHRVNIFDVCSLPAIQAAVSLGEFHGVLEFITPGVPEMEGFLLLSRLSRSDRHRALTQSPYNTGESPLDDNVFLACPPAEPRGTPVVSATPTLIPAPTITATRTHTPVPTAPTFTAAGTPHATATPPPGGGPSVGPTPCRGGALSRRADDYLFLAKDRVFIKTGSIITGNVGVNERRGSLRVSAGAELVAGTVGVADRTRLQASAQIWDLFTNSLFSDLSRVIIGGTVTSPVAPPVFVSEPLIVPDPFEPANFPPAFPITCGGQSRFGEVGEGFVLTPGSYNRVTVARDGRLTLESGTYQFCELSFPRGAVDVTGPATINVRDLLNGGDASTFGPVGATLPEQIQVNFEGVLPVRIGQDSVFRARLFAPNTFLRLGRRAQVTGHFVVEELRSDPGFTATTCGNGVVECGETCDPPGSQPRPGGNRCRSDCTFCGDGLVQFGEQCDDGNSDDGDGCRSDCTLGPGTPHPTPPTPICTPGTTMIELTSKEGSDLDVGWTGIAHHQQWPVGAPILSGNCSGGACQLDGNASGTPFGAPLPLSAGGVATCLVNTFRAPVSGTYDCATGCGASDVALTAAVFLSPDVASPCPTCLGDPAPNDGQKGGTCHGGANAGGACDTGALSPEFGPTSNDCLPRGSSVGEPALDLTPLTTGTTSRNGGVDCVAPGTPPGACQCPGQIRPNACDSGVCPASGVCESGPIDGRCSNEPFRSCELGTGTRDCEDVFPGAGTCQGSLRQCFGDSISRSGQCGTDGTFVSIFCMPATRAPAVNTVSGLPGPVALSLPFHSSGCQCGAAAACPSQITFEGSSTSGVLDLGWTGLGHDQPLIDDALVTVGVTGCTGSAPSCGVCNYVGPLPNSGVDAMQNRRCSGNSTLACTSDADCGGAGTCKFFLGSYLPLSAGGVSNCVERTFAGPMTGTVDVDTGTIAGTESVLWRVFFGATLDQPCPQCVGDPLANDGVRAGACSGGARDGQACDRNGTSPIGTFGSTSLDCPPLAGSLIAALPLNLSSTSDTATRTLSASNPGCSAVPGSKCQCDTCDNAAATTCTTNADCPAGGICGGKRCRGGTNNGSRCVQSGASSECPGGACGVPGQATSPNSCNGGVGDCIVAANGEGTCASGPVDQFCSPAETFRGCLVDGDCPFPGDTCSIARLRPCFDNGTVGESVSAFGQPDVPQNHQSDPTLATLFCLGPTSSAAVNAANGLPGLVRMQLQTHVVNNGTP